MECLSSSAGAFASDATCFRRRVERMAAKMPPPPKPRITFGKFANVDMRVAQVQSAAMAEGTAKPCRVLKLDVGPLGTLTSVGQFALLSEEELVGRKVVVCCNLGPREMG